MIPMVFVVISMVAFLIFAIYLSMSGGHKPVQRKHYHGPTTPITTEDLEFEKSTNNIPAIIVFDLETTGLPRVKRATPNNINSFPSIVQIAWMVFDKELKIIKKQSHIIKQPRKIPDLSTNIHKITNEMASQYGVDISTAVNEILQDVEKCIILAAHNIEFDYNVLMSNLYRNGINTAPLEKINLFCTMKTGTFFCAIQRYGGGYKYPTLAELYTACYPEKSIDPEILHSALVDVAICAKCMDKFYELNVV
ncbi:MAG: 3'-5' exonuclease [Tannerellaceae bacterium]|jgi:DNA polymerase III epsilon subunit-like protein|nr:3'-5' exonuclease [Tannerellaceae bacterium]